MLDPCPRCASLAVRTSSERFSHVVGDLRFKTAIVHRRCELCDWTPRPVDELENHEASIATWLALFGPVSSDTFRFLRRSLRISLEETAELLGTDVERVVAIDRGTTRPSVRTWLKLAWLVRDRAAGIERTRFPPLAVPAPRAPRPFLHRGRPSRTASARQRKAAAS